MSKYLTLHVEDFAKIRKATIEAAPLMLFVGDNNSGKSYLLSLLWGLIGGVNFGRWASTRKLYSEIKFDGVEKILDLWKTKNYDESNEAPDPVFSFKNMLLVSAEEQHALAEGFNTFLATAKDELVDEIFNTDETSIQSIRLDIPFREDLMVGYQKQDADLPWKLGVPHQGYHIFQYKNALDLIDKYRVLVCDKSVLIPAPRTGYLLTFKTLIGESVQYTFSRSKKPGDTLTEPQVSYLKRRGAFRHQDLEKIKDSSFRESIKSIISFVEQDIISGEIKLSKTPLPELLYRPEGFDKLLPLYLSSGVVTEVAGFLSLLKFGQFERIFIYEEPEMCLHPELQWKMARVLVKLVNAGFSVWASTHSDIIIQHVNNMIKLSNHPNGEQLRLDHNYDEDDVISPDKVRMYQFDVDLSDHKTDVKLLECGDNGFRIPTFGKVFRELRDEVWSLHINKEET